MSSNSSGDSSPESSRSFLGTQSDGFSAAAEVAAFTNLKVLEPNNQIRELQTIIRDVWVVCLARKGAFLYDLWPPQGNDQKWLCLLRRSTGELLALLYAVNLSMRVRCSQIRLVIEEGLNCLPSYKRKVVTPTGQWPYNHFVIVHWCVFDNRPRVRGRMVWEDELRCEHYEEWLAWRRSDRLAMLNKRFVRRGSNGERLKGLLPLDADRKDID